MWGGDYAGRGEGNCIRREVLVLIPRAERSVGDGRARAGCGVREGAEGGSGALRPERQGDNGRPEAPASGAGQQTGRAGEDGARAGGPPSRHRGGSPDRRRGLYARLPHLHLADRSVRAEPVLAVVGFGTYRLWRAAFDRGYTGGSWRQHTPEVGSRAAPDDKHTPAER